MVFKLIHVSKRHPWYLSQKSQQRGKHFHVMTSSCRYMSTDMTQFILWVQKAGHRPGGYLVVNWESLPWKGFPDRDRGATEASLATASVCCLVDSLWPSDTIWRRRSRSALVQVMACCLTAPSHYLNQCWLNHQRNTDITNYIIDLKQSNRLHISNISTNDHCQPLPNFHSNTHTTPHHTNTSASIRCVVSPWIHELLLHIPW